MCAPLRHMELEKRVIERQSEDPGYRFPYIVNYVNVFLACFLLPIR